MINKDFIKIECNVCSNYKVMDFGEYKKIKIRLKCGACGSKNFISYMLSSQNAKKIKESIKTKVKKPIKTKVKKPIKVKKSVLKSNKNSQTIIPEHVRKIALGDKVKNRFIKESDGSSRAGWMKDRNSRNS